MKILDKLVSMIGSIYMLERMNQTNLALGKVEMKKLVQVKRLVKAFERLSASPDKL